MNQGMDKRFRYREKNVHDIPVEDSFVRVWSADGAIDSQMITQALRSLIKTGFVHPYIALMPDYHPGQHAMIGSVIPTRRVVLPSVIGGDLGCGMVAVRLPIESQEISTHLTDIRKRIAGAVPVGTSYNSTVTDRVQSNPLWQREPQAPIMTNRVRNKLIRQFGSLGAGNHFLEIQEDTEQRVWITVHSGSRNLGVLIRDYYVERGAAETGIDPKLYSKVAYFEGASELAGDYLSDLQYALDFAVESRREMLLRILEILSGLYPSMREAGGADFIGESFDLTHNFVAQEDHWGEKLYVHRKGATRAMKGLMGIVPGSMGSNSYVIEGRGNEYSFCSCAHGAGRAMSRAEAFRAISEKDFKRSMQRIVYEHDDRLKDESPLAYKDVQRVMRGQRDLVKILYELRPLMSIKGIDSSAKEDREDDS